MWKDLGKIICHNKLIFLSHESKIRICIGSGTDSNVREGRFPHQQIVLGTPTGFPAIQLSADPTSLERASDCTG